MYDKKGDPVQLGDLCERGAQLRPHIVWFGEAVPHFDLALEEVQTADRVLVIGTSLTVYPAARLVKKAFNAKEKVIVQPEIDHPPAQFRWIKGNAAEQVPVLVDQWLQSVI